MTQSSPARAFAAAAASLVEHDDVADILSRLLLSCAEVLHVDQDLVVADKPHFLPVAPTGVYLRQTLLSRLVRQLDNPELVPLHRIDRGTAGLVLFSARRRTRDAYQALFRERSIEKGLRSAGAGSA